MADRFDYRRLPWGELIDGTKAELQALGLGVGLAFPGEAGANKHSMAITDPRGLPGRITREDDHYSAEVQYPGLPVSPYKRRGVSFAAGVELFQSPHGDSYVGHAEALEKCGLIDTRHLPGQPGMRKMRVTIFADGSLPTGAHTVVDSRRREPGARLIERTTGGRYEVTVFLSKEEKERRGEVWEAKVDHYEEAVRAIPKPPALEVGGRTKCDRPVMARATAPMQGLQSAAALHRRKMPPGWRVIVNTATQATRAEVTHA